MKRVSAILGIISFLLAGIAFAQDTTAKTISLTSLNGFLYTEGKVVDLPIDQCAPEIAALVKGVPENTRIAWRWKDPAGKIAIAQSFKKEGTDLKVSGTDTVGKIIINNMSLCAAGKWELYDFKVLGANYNTADDSNFDTQEKIEGVFSLNVTIQGSPTVVAQNTATKVPVTASPTPNPNLKLKSGADDFSFLIVLIGILSATVFTFGKQLLKKH